MTYSAKAQTSTSLTTLTVPMTSTSYATYIQSVTPLTLTTTSSIYNGNLILSPIRSPGCGATFPVNAKPSDRVSISFNSDNPIEFYLMAVNYAPDTFCAVGAYLIPPSLQAATLRTSYTLDWSPSIEYYNVNQSTQFYIILFNRQLVQASIFVTVQVTSSQTTSSNLYSTETTWLTSYGAQTESFTTTVTPTPTPAPTLSLFSAQNLWIILPILILILLAIIFSSKKRKRSENTQI